MKPNAPAGYATVNPFIITRDAQGLITFLTAVFGGTERPDAHTMDDDGLLLHAELPIGDTTVMFADRKPDWPFMPSLLQVYVDDLEGTLATARRLGATIVTEPTDFFGDVFSRFLDPWKNMWWVYRHTGAEDGADEVEASWDAGDADAGGDASWSAAATPELTYIYDTLVSTMPTLRE